MAYDRKQYLGDAVYADFDGYALVLTVEDGYIATDTIVLEPEVFSALLLYAERLKGELAARKETQSL